MVTGNILICFCSRPAIGTTAPMLEFGYLIGTITARIPTTMLGSGSTTTQTSNLK